MKTGGGLGLIRKSPALEEMQAQEICNNSLGWAL
jgi:hypothetical protein